MVLWLPSQKGLFSEAPERHRAACVPCHATRPLPARMVKLPSSSSGPSHNRLIVSLPPEALRPLPTGPGYTKDHGHLRRVRRRTCRRCGYRVARPIGCRFRCQENRIPFSCSWYLLALQFDGVRPKNWTVGRHSNSTPYRFPSASGLSPGRIYASLQLSVLIMLRDRPACCRSAVTITPSATKWSRQ